MGRLALGTNARILPVSIAGANSRLFYLAGRIHPLLRTVLLPREFLNRQGGSVGIRMAQAVSLKELPASEQTAEALTRHVRQAVENIRPSAPAPRQNGRECGERLTQIAPADLADDILRLPPDSQLIASGDFDVYCADAGQIPHILDEIGRLRERAFRAVGEGTGRPSDLDPFDRHYLHLFVWNRKTAEVVGAYRIGRADRIVASTGVSGLYTRTLFRYDETLLNRLPPALELGRSFVRPEYQRDHSALLLLWKGICAFVQRHPDYRVLFGAVSISARYTDRTRHMLMRFLEQNHLHRQLAELVSSHHPYSPTRTHGASPAETPRTLEEADALAEQFERDGRGMPVLLRQYLKLNARVLGFNVDPSFGDVLDALMMVDLLQVDLRILRRYFGSSMRTFLEYHTPTSHAA
jgi:putative hemolysin